MRIVTQLKGMDGSLSNANKVLLDDLLAHASQSLWSKAKNVVICDQPLTTLNAAVRAVSQGRVEIGEFPDTFTIYRALLFAVKKRQRCFHKMEVCDSES